MISIDERRVVPGQRDDFLEAPLVSIARASAWTIAARWSIRSVGLINTIILARMLSPADFGIIAMALVAVNLVQVFSEAGQALAVIRHPAPTADHFDTAWTMSVLAGIAVALVLIGAAPLAAWYFHEPRVTSVITVLALAPLIEGFVNIGAVAGFRRSLQFNKDFAFTIVRKFSAVIVTVPLALLWRDYWALAVGMVAARLVTVVASYLMHPYRPRLRLIKLRELWSFSAWTQIAAVGGFVGDQADQVIIGGLGGAMQMGAYSVAADVATAPTEELVVPAMRATFPVYATMLNEPAKLAESYLSMLGFAAIIALSTGFGVALVSHDLVEVVLGRHWLSATNLVPWLAISGGMLGVARSVSGMLSVTGNARLNAVRVWMFALMLPPAALLGALGWGVEGVAAGRMVVTVLIVPVMFYSLTRVIPVDWSDILKCVWRPAIATGMMMLVVSQAGIDGIGSAALRLVCDVGFGVAVFFLSLLALWSLAGRPAGAESALINQLRRVSGWSRGSVTNARDIAASVGASRTSPSRQTAGDFDGGGNILLLGVARSGTSWLAKILDSHPDVLYRHEPDNEEQDQRLPWFGALADLTGHYPRAREYLDRLVNHRSLRAAGSVPIPPKRHRRGPWRLLRAGFILGLRGAEMLLGTGRWPSRVAIPDFIAGGDRTGVRVVVKSVSSLGYARLFAEAWPASRIVIIVRHPCGSVESQLRGVALGKFPDLEPLGRQVRSARAEQLGLKVEDPSMLSTVEQLAWEWAFLNQSMLEDVDGLSNVKVIMYSDLAADPVGVARDLFAFLGLSWSPQTENFIKKSSVAPIRERYFSLQRDPVQASNKWRNALSAEDQQRVLAIACRTAIGRACCGLSAQQEALEPVAAVAPTALPRPTAPSSEETPFFIVGSGRSGTTMLRLILSGHSRIHIPPETWYIADLAHELPLTDPLAPPQVARALEIMTSHYRWPDMGIEAADLRHWANALDRPRLRDLLDLVYRHHLRIHGKQRFGDKTPNYFHLLPVLDTLYPGAKFIHLIRDGRDVAISFIDVGWGRYYQPEFNWARVMKSRREFLRSSHKYQLLEVKYEDLVLEPRREVMRICEFLGEEFEPGMLDWHQMVELVPTRERPIHRKLDEPLRQDAVSEWRRKLSSVECFAMEACLHRDLRQLGYSLRFASVGWRPVMAVSGWILSGAGPVLGRGIPFLQRRRLLPKRLYL